MPEIISSGLGIPTSNGGGWLDGMLEQIHIAERIELVISCPINKMYPVKTGTVKNITYHLFKVDAHAPYRYDKNLEGIFKSILDNEKPDIVHVWGSEFPATLAMMNASKETGMLPRTLIWMQGLTSVYAQHFYANLPIRTIYGWTLRDFIRLDNLYFQRKKFLIRGDFEIKALQLAQHVCGRTDWDRACVFEINPNVRYHFCNESLRNSFYHAKWSIDECERNSIFISQAGYPIKGLHFLLEALPTILAHYPDTRVYVAGYDVTYSNSEKKIIPLTGYGKYLLQKMKQLGIHKKVIFIGSCSEKEMRERYLKCHVYVSPSSIENSPNSLGEAMILGVPIVASDVGGVKDLMRHNSDGFIYQSDAPYMLAYYICRIFADDALTEKFATSSRIRARTIHDRIKNANNLLDIYAKLITSAS